MKSILLTGGAGFIGSHTCLALLEKGYSVSIIDSFANSSLKVIDRVKQIFKTNNPGSNLNLEVFDGDIRDKSFLKGVFVKITKHKKVDGIIHLAGLKSVLESIRNPFLYWETNVVGTINLLEIMVAYECSNFVFSSSATVYAKTINNLLKEDSYIKPESPYGNSKASAEIFMKDIFNAPFNDAKFASLRYFNPIGAHHSGLLGENPITKPTNIFPLIVNTAMGFQKELEVYGNDWPTEDGTAIRDYIHIMDLADAHLKILDYLIENENVFLNLNIGTGIGTSVLELVKTFERVNNVKVPYVFKKRRSGDTAYLVADNSISAKKFDILPKQSVEKMCKDGWKWKILNPNGI